MLTNDVKYADFESKKAPSMASIQTFPLTPLDRAFDGHSSVQAHSW